MTVYSSGELFWDTAEVRAPRWVLVVDGPPGVARRRLDPQEPSTPQAAPPANCGSSFGARFTRTPASGR